MTSIIDRAIEAVSPKHAAMRALHRAQIAALDSLPGAHSSASTSPSADEGSSSSARGGSRWWSPRARDARSDTLPSITSERGKSRELSRTSPIAAGAINTNIDRVVGTGLALSAQPNRHILGWTVEQAREWKRTTQAEFSLWSDSPECDQANTLNFYEQQGLVLRSTLESGDCFSWLPNGQRTSSMPYTLRVQVVEADRVGNPFGRQDTDDMAGGVKFNASGAPISLHLYKRHPGAGYMAGARVFEGDWVDMVGPSGRKRCLHHMRKLRAGQPRGVPYLAPIIECIKQISRLTDAEISAAVISSFFTVFIESGDGNPAPVFSGEKGADTQNAEIAMGMGSVVGLAKGEKATFANPTRPNPNFAPFVEGVLTQIGMALGIPRELLIKQFNSSYSASKAALLDGWIYFRGVRTWLARSFCQPVYETWLAEAVASGRIVAPGFFTDPLMRWAYTRAAWHGDSMGSINPKDEVAAYAAAIDARLMTHERAEWELFGTDYDDTFEQKRSEHEQLKAADMLPAPKAGAAAPQSTKPTE
jgi:lambda family phage portal protein